MSVRDVCEKARASAYKGRQLHAASSFPATADIPEPASLPRVQPPTAAELVPPPPAIQKKYRLPSGCWRERGAEPVGAVPPPAQQAVPHVPQEAAPLPVLLPPEGDEEVLPDRELNLDGLVSPPLVKLHKLLAKRSELLKLHLKHYHMLGAVQAPDQRALPSRRRLSLI